jgi:hypothetical protein
VGFVDDDNRRLARIRAEVDRDLPTSDSPPSNSPASPPPAPTRPAPADKAGRVSAFLIALAVLAAVAAAILFTPMIGSGEFTGRCQDGWDTPSAGGPGTCSWHGGEAHAPKRSLWDVIAK